MIFSLNHSTRFTFYFTQGKENQDNIWIRLWNSLLDHLLANVIQILDSANSYIP